MRINKMTNYKNTCFKTMLFKLHFSSHHRNNNKFKIVIFR